MFSMISLLSLPFMITIIHATGTRRKKQTPGFKWPVIVDDDGESIVIPYLPKDPSGESIDPNSFKFIVNGIEYQGIYGAPAPQWDIGQDVAISLDCEQDGVNICDVGAIFKCVRTLKNAQGVDEVVETSKTYTIIFGGGIEEFNPYKNGDLATNAKRSKERDIVAQPLKPDQDQTIQNKVLSVIGSRKFVIYSSVILSIIAVIVIVAVFNCRSSKDTSRQQSGHSVV